MKRLLTIAIFSLILFTVVMVLSGFTFSLGGGGDIFNQPPQPRMLYPIYDQVKLTGKDYLEFKWIINDLVNIRYCVFRLYKGYNTYASTRILKKQIPSSESSYKIKASLFEDGQVYTWVLQEVSNGGQKSDPIYNSFRVIKK